MRITRFQKLLSILLALAALLIAANAWLAFHAEEVLANSEYWVTHTLQVITDLERALHTAADAESSVRGYIITGDSRYLIPYDVASRQLPAQFEMLEHLTADNPSQVMQLQKANAISQQKLAALRAAIDLRRAQGLQGQAALMENEDVVSLMAALHETVQGSEQEERRLLAIRLQESADARAEAKLTVALASVLDILFVVFSFWSLNYERRLRQRAAESSARLEKLQSVTEVAFNQLNAGELTSELLRRLRPTAHTDALVLCRWLEASLEIELASAEGIDVPLNERLPVRPDGPIAQAARTGTVLRLLDGEVARLPIEGLREDLGSILIVPMSVAGKVIALLIAGRKQSNGFSQEDEDLLALAADRIGLALDRAAAYDAERAARQAAEQSAAQIQILNEELEERVRQRTAELEATNRELEAFSYSVSHDLRAPLRSVDGFSVALEEDYGAVITGEGLHYLARIRAGVQRMGQLIDALLQLSRITRAELNVEHVQLSTLAQAVAEELEQANPGRALEFVIEPGLEVQGDHRLLRAVLENMLGNAIKFTANEATARIAFGFSPGKRAYFVQDNGAGFDQQYAGKLFVAFQRLHGEKDFQGSGIGLATVARVIRRHHGEIWAEGAVGEGATFWFTLN
jgi:signal transduction histidine kinase/CHASE3 domain sensor protein